jgi:putative nucleotidyltransferase with HDIG domain
MALPISQALLATIAASKGELNLALSQIRAAEAKGRETNNYTFSYVIPYVVETLLQLGRLQEAMHAAQEARDLISSTGNTEIETRLWVSMGEIHARLGEEPAARSYFERALERAKAGEELHIQARAAKGLAWMDIESGQRESAEAHLEVALELARSLSLRLLEAECLLLAGQLAEGPVALAHYEKAYGAAESLNVPGLQALALYGQGKLTTEPEAGLALIKQAKSRLAVLLEQLSIEDADAYLSFMERARLQREELHAEEIEMTSPAAATLPGDASLEDRSAWLTSQIAAAAQAQKSESNRLESIAHEFNLLASSAGDSLRLQELELANRRMGQLLKFSLAVNNVTDLETVLEQAVDLIVEITAAERGFLLFFENGQIRSQVSRVNVDRKSPLDWQFSKSIVDKVLNTGEVVCVFDALSDTQFNQAQSVVDLNLRTVICVPMRIRGKMFGAIYVDRQSINENFTPEDLEMVMGLATQASGAIENARIHQEWVEKSKRLELLNTLSKTISTSLDMEEVLDLVLKMTLDVSRAERGFLFMLDETGRKLLCRGARDLKGPLRVDEDHEISQSICAKALASGEPISVADAMNDEEFQFNQSISALNLRMVMCVPMTVQGRVIGLLYVDSQAVVNAFGDKDLDLLSAIAGHASVAIDNAKLHTHVQKLADDLKRTFYSFVQALGASIDAKHPLTAGHSFRVTDYTVRLARRIGMSEDEIENLRIAGLLHDVGKIGTPDHILGKPGSFTPEEYEIMKKHVVHTREILDTIYFPESQGHIPAIAGAHHEKWDGTGYPNQLAGDDIPFGGRIMALGDVFDAITSKRDYREAMPLPQALDIIRKGSGSHFDPALAQAFVRMIEEEGVSGPDKEVVVPLAHAQEARLV